jgi:hypothetical protein
MYDQGLNVLRLRIYLVKFSVAREKEQRISRGENISGRNTEIERWRFNLNS